MTAWHSPISVPRRGPQDKGMEMGLTTLCETNYNPYPAGRASAQCLRMWHARPGAGGGSRPRCHDGRSAPLNRDGGDIVATHRG